MTGLHSLSKKHMTSMRSQRVGRCNKGVKLLPVAYFKHGQIVPSSKPFIPRGSNRFSGFFMVHQASFFNDSFSFLSQRTRNVSFASTSVSACISHEVTLTPSPSGNINNAKTKIPQARCTVNISRPRCVRTIPGMTKRFPAHFLRRVFQRGSAEILD